MRVALIMLLLLALASIPGSLLPQWPQDGRATRDFIDANPFWGPLADRLGLLDVFGSAWFTAIYLLLFASLIGCIVPRVGVYWRELRSPVPATPSRLTRYQPVLTASVITDARQVTTTAQETLSPPRASIGDGARRYLRPRWWRWVADYRIRVDERDTRDGGRELALSAHQGHLRELGNLVFHLALVAVLAAIAAGSVLTYRGQALIVEGATFTNAVVAYDTYEAGALYDPAGLEPWTLRLESLEAQFSVTGQAEGFTASATLTEPGAAPRQVEAEVNRPIQVDGAKIYLQGNGYAPRVTVTDAAGEVAFAGAVPFLPQDDAYTSTGVIKVPDVSTGDQIGLRGTLYPTAVTDGDQTLSAHPSPVNPIMELQVFTGDLGLDDGVPQNVYELDESRLSPVQDDDGMPVTLRLGVGESVDLPDGLGTLTWEEMPRFAAFDLRRDPSLPWLLTASLFALAGLSVSLFARRRRLWLVVPLAPDGRERTTVVTAAAWAPAHDAGVTEELERLLETVTGRTTLEEDP